MIPHNHPLLTPSGHYKAPLHHPQAFFAKKSRRNKRLARLRSGFEKSIENSKMAHILKVERQTGPNGRSPSGWGRSRWGKKKESACKPGSVENNHSSRRRVTAALQQPTRKARGPRVSPCGDPSLFGLAPDGVFRAAAVTSDAVRSYRTFSPLPVPGCPGHRRFVLCGTFRSLAAPRRYLASCPLEPGLSSPALRQQRLFGRLRWRFYALRSSRSGASLRASS